MTDSNRHKSNYNKTNPALSTLRSKVAQALLSSAPNSMVDGSASMLNQTDYLQELKRHCFMANPAGNGLDELNKTWKWWCPLKEVYSSLSKSPQESKRLFELPNRTNTVWVRPMTDSNRHKSNYNKTNPALSTLRSKVAQALLASAPNSMVGGSASMLNQTDYLQELKRHCFLDNPAGNGLDELNKT